MATAEEFAGRVAIVTGASRGIGKATARLFAERGGRAVLVGRDRQALEQERRAFGDRAVVVIGDVADPACAASAVATAINAYGTLDTLFNVAGSFPTARLEDTSDDIYAATLAANFTGTFLMCRAAAPALRAAGAGSIVNVSSTAARLGTPGLAVYSGAKAAVEGFSRSIAIELAPAVRVNTVSIGPTLTETVDALIQSDTTGAVEAVTKALPLQRLGRPEEIAEMILFLGGDRSSFVTGQVFHVNGGGVMP